MRLYLFLLFLVLSVSTVLHAQDNTTYLYNTYIGKPGYFEPVDFVTDTKYTSVRPVKDSLFIQVMNDKLLQKLINLKINNKIYGIEVIKTDSTDLEKCLELLQQFPRLEYLKFSEIGPFGPPKMQPYILPANMVNLQQLKGIELYGTRALDISDALTKLARLKQLTLLNIRVTNFKWSADLSVLPDLKIIKCSTEQLLNLKNQNLNWEVVDLSGTIPQRNNDDDALAKLKNMHRLKKLSLSFFNLADLKSLSELSNITTLELSVIETKPSGNLFKQLSYLKQLTSLSLNTPIDSTQDVTPIGRLKNLKFLCLSQTASLKQHMEVLTTLKNLEALNISYNALTVLPPALFNLPHLKQLDASGNKIEALPLLKIKNSGLTKINMKFNRLKLLPATITSLNKLKYIDVSYNDIDSIPLSGWDNLSQLEYANFAVNHLAYYPGGLQKVTQLKTLDLSTNNLTALPDFELKPYQLTILKLSSNLLTHLPGHIGYLNKLEELYIGGNNLADLPQSLGDCDNLKILDCHTISYPLGYYSHNNPEHTYNTHHDEPIRANKISVLPAGLANDAVLRELNLADNAGIDEQNVFTVILSRPRPYFNVNLSGTGITSLPASAKWARMTFSQLNLSKNKLTTLPVEFASVPVFTDINLIGNPFVTDQAIFNVSIKTPGDMRVIFETLGLPVTTIATNAQYSTALAERSSSFYYKQDWAKAVQYADRSRAVDSTTYNRVMRFDEIGVCRLKLKDYTGAIGDFKKFGAHEEKVSMHWGPSLTAAETFEAQAYLALHQPEKAAETHLYFAQKHGSQTGYQEAAVLCKSIGDNIKAKQWLDTALIHYQSQYTAYKKYKFNNSDFMLNYAEVLIIADKPQQTIQLINDQAASFNQPISIAIKNYLLATAKYLSNPADYEQIKTDLIASTKQTGKVTGWDYDMFNSWLVHSGKGKAQQEAVMTLQNMVK